jgi:ubiquitin carboxyl-terminal hydrolase 14
VCVSRQKLMAKGAWIGTLKDDADMSTMKFKEGQNIMLMGTADVVVAPVEKVRVH